MENMEKGNNDEGGKDSTIAASSECIISGNSNQCKNEINGEGFNHELKDGMDKELGPSTWSNRENGEKLGGNWVEEDQEEVSRVEVGEETEVMPLLSLHNLEDGSFQNKSKEKKRLLGSAGDGNDNDPTPKHGLKFNSQKKYKQGECLSVEPEFGSAVSPLECSTGLSNATDDKCFSEKHEGSGSGSPGKRRRVEWEAQAQANEERLNDTTRSDKRRICRWLSADMQMKLLGPLQLPNFMDENVLEFDVDPEILGLKMELADVNSKLKEPVLVDERQEEEQSPSPDTVYNEVGIRINTHEVRLREKLIRKRHGIISDLIKKHPTFKPPPSYKPSRLFKKLYVPVKQYPKYDFVGSILGCRGDNQKRMEKETGARISLGGAGSFRKRKHVSSNDDLHILVEADDENSLDAAVRMVGKLLVPVKTSGHKGTKLGELAPGNADINGDTRPSVSPVSPLVSLEHRTHLPGSQNFTLTPSSLVSSLSNLSGTSSLGSFSSFSDWFALSSPCVMSQPRISADCSGVQFASCCGSPSAMQIPPINFFQTPESTVKQIVCPPSDNTHSRT